jgi:carbon monoxide dehydrogenase subunit G
MRWESTRDERLALARPFRDLRAMKVELQKSYAIPAPADLAWLLLNDIEKLAGCMPGATITERIDACHYRGNVAVKFGPASMAFRGEIEVAELAPAERSVHLIGKGVDSTGSSGASMDLKARIEAIDATSCTLVGTSEVSVSGKAAAFGGRMMGSVADQVLKQFATNFAARVPQVPQMPQVPQGLQQAQAGTPGTAAGAAAPAAGPTAIDANTTGLRNPTAPAAYGAGATAPAPAPVQLNGLALGWAVLRDWLAGLFGPKKA